MEVTPYIGHCAFCQDGLLRLMQCDTCRKIVAICDECELIWADVPAVSGDPSAPSSSAHPRCPACQTSPTTWSKPDAEAIGEAELSEYISGNSP